MTACLLWFSAFLLAMNLCVFAFARTMAGFSAGVTTTFERSTAYQAAENVGTPTRLIFQSFLAAEAGLLCEKRTFGTFFIVCMAVVRNLGMPTNLLPLAREVARWRTCAAGQRRLENRSATVAGYVVEDSFFAGSTWSFMAKIWTVMVTTLKWSIACASANVLCLKFFTSDMAASM